MKKQYRIKKNEEFQCIINKKHFVTSAQYALYFVKKQLDDARVGISVGKKLGNAVNRNKVKRQIRMMLQELHFNELNFDAIIIVRAKYLNFSYEDNRKQLENLLKKVKM